MLSQNRDVQSSSLIAISGVGGVGAEFLSQLEALSIKGHYIRLVAISRSSKGISRTPQEHPIPFPEWKSLLEASRESVSVAGILDLLRYHDPHRSIFVDNTSDSDIPKFYPAILKAGISVVTPNKKGFSGGHPLWEDIFSSCANTPPLYTPHDNPTATPNRGSIYHESTVGAGLPILSTLTDLLATGDKIRRIEGVFSGTMSYLFNTFAPITSGSSTPNWSTTVLAAKEAGYTEPDPRDDLNGVDVARKLIILARLCGPAVFAIASLDSLPVQSLIPDELNSCSSGDEFLARLPQFDQQMEKIKAEAASKGSVIRYVGKIDVEKKEIKVGLESFTPGSPIASLQGSDNLVAFYTDRYPERPLVVQGAGAGGAVTAMGVSADVLRCIQRMA